MLLCGDSINLSAFLSFVSCASSQKSKPWQSICVLWSWVLFSTFCTHSWANLKGTLRKVDSIVQQHHGQVHWHKVQRGTNSQQVQTVHQKEKEKIDAREEDCKDERATVYSSWMRKNEILMYHCLDPFCVSYCLCNNNLKCHFPIEQCRLLLHSCQVCVFCLSEV